MSEEFNIWDDLAASRAEERRRLLADHDSDGPETVQNKILSDYYESDQLPVARDWLAHQAAKAKEALDVKQAAAAQKQADYAERAFWIAVAAAVISVVAIIVAIFT